MYKILLLSHGRFSEGLLDTAKLFTPTTENITAISYYTENVDGEQQLIEYIDQIKTEDKVIVLTDILWGSVNQQAMVRFMTHSNVYLISGMNLPILLEMIACNPDDVNEEFVLQKVNSCKDSLISVRSLEITFNENDE